MRSPATTTVRLACPSRFRYRTVYPNDYLPTADLNEPFYHEPFNAAVLECRTQVHGVTLPCPKHKRIPMKKEMLINVLQPEECRIAILEDGILEELYVERTSQESYVGNIYKGRIVNIEPSIQAAFVDFGIGRNGFLHVSDVDRAYYQHLVPTRSDRGSRGGRDRSGRGERAERGGRRSGKIGTFSEEELVEIESGEPIDLDDDFSEMDPSASVESSVVSLADDQPSGLAHTTSAVDDSPWGGDILEESDTGDATPPADLPTSHATTSHATTSHDEPNGATWGAGLLDELPPAEADTPAPDIQADHPAPAAASTDSAQAASPLIDPSQPSEPTEFGGDLVEDEPTAPLTARMVSIEIVSEVVRLDQPEPPYSAELAPGVVPPQRLEPPQRSEPAQPTPSADTPEQPEQAEPVEPVEPVESANPTESPRGHRKKPAKAERASPAKAQRKKLPPTGDNPDDADPLPPTNQAESVKRKAKKPRSAKSAESAELLPNTEGEEPSATDRETDSDESADPKRRRSRTRRKSKGDDAPPEDKPRLMDSAERRTDDDPNHTSSDENLFADFGRFDDQPNPPIAPQTAADSADRADPSDECHHSEPPSAVTPPSAVPPPSGGPGDLSSDTPLGFDQPESSSEPGSAAAVEDAPVVQGEIVDDEADEDLSFGADEELVNSEEASESAALVAESSQLPELDVDEEPYAPPSQSRRDSRDRRGGRDRDRKDRRNGREASRDARDGKDKPPIQEIFKRGQEVIVQVTKEGIGSKGPTLTTYIGIAGRYLVLMPGLDRIGVSRKIDDEQQRRRLKEILSALKPPPGIGFIIRTAGSERTTRELQNDLVYLLKLWQVVVRRIRRLKAPVEVFRETDMITRTIRDTFTPDIDTIWVDEPNAYQHAREFLESVMPTYANRLRLYEGTEPLFFKYRIEEEIAKIQNKYVPLPHGGSIVIEQTEALVAIDVNSGNFRADNNPEETAFQINLHAAREIARQLRLRDLGGVIVNDFIDMREERHRRAVEQAMRDAIKRDRARTKVLKISPFGLIEMTRQRIRPSLKKSIYQDCPWCRATGYVKSPESMSLDVMRLLQLAAHREGIHEIVIRVHSEVANYLLNRKRREVVQLEQKGELTITITGLPHVPPETLEITCYDRNGTETRFQPFEPPARLGQRSTPVSSQRSGRDGRDR